LTTTAETVVLDVHGIGYEIYCSGAVFKKIVVGEVAEIFTYLQVKEDGITLFGLESVKEKEIFLKLTSVSGVGPKLGIAVLTGLNADEFATAIATADVKKLSAVKGLGKKTAEKIVLELHGKISAAEVMEASGDSLKTETAEPKAKLTAMEEEGVSALMGLGFTKAESVQAVKKAMEKGVTTVEELIMRALQGGV
jgi:Holliday junction DNA helicase RuvA